jgi:DNA-binding MarR family transcriptional regulator
MLQTLSMDTSDATRLMAAVQALVRRFSLVERADIACCGMTVAQAATLEALTGSDGLRLGVLCRRLGITASTLTRNLQRLRDRGLVAVVADGGDRRASRVALTESGRRAAADLARQEAAFAASIVDALGRSGTTEVLAAMERLLGAIRTASEGCCPGAFDHLMSSLEWTEGRTHHEQ